MKISIIPERPQIFSGQPFSVEVALINCKRKVMWAGAQISGILYAKNDQSKLILSKEIQGVFCPNEGYYSYNFAMSGSRMIASEFHCPKTFCLKITVDKIPPSYSGGSIDIVYELCIFAQASGDPVTSTRVPLIVLCRNNENYCLPMIQSVAIFNIETIESQTKMANYSQICPFSPQNPKVNSISSLLQTSDGLKASLEIDNTSYPGSILGGLIDLRGGDSKLTSVTVNLIANEIFSNFKNSHVVSKQFLSMSRCIMKSLSLIVPMDISAQFSTEIFRINYEVEFVLFNETTGKQWTWSTPIDMVHPEFSQTTPRVHIT